MEGDLNEDVIVPPDDTDPVEEHAAAVGESEETHCRSGVLEVPEHVASPREVFCP